jgi:hypothetical protein
VATAQTSVCLACRSPTFYLITLCGEASILIWGPLVWAQKSHHRAVQEIVHGNHELRSS